MSKKIVIIGAAVVLVLAVALVAAGDAGNATACKDKAKASSASAKSAACVQSASACTRSAASSACCASGKAAVAGYSKGACCSKATTESAALGEIIDDIPYREAKRLVVAGAMECGHCTYHKTASCAPLVKTEDGKVYPLLQNNLTKQMRHTETEKGFELSTRVRKIDGVKYLEVLSYRAL